MPGIESAQGTEVTFDGVTIGYLTGWDISVDASTPVETTSIVSTVVGTGASARVVKNYDVTSIESPTFAFTFRGPPSFSYSDVGKKATLTFSGGGSVWSGEAILKKFSQSAKTNQYTEGSAEFLPTGD